MSHRLSFRINFLDFLTWITQHASIISLLPVHSSPPLSGKVGAAEEGPDFSEVASVCRGVSVEAAGKTEGRA